MGTRAHQAYISRLRADAGLYRALAAVHPDPVGAAYIGVAVAIDEQIEASEERAAQAKPVKPPKAKPAPPTDHVWASSRFTPAELATLSAKKRARLEAGGCRRCACGVVSNTDYPFQFKAPGKPWVQVRIPCARADA